MLGTESSAQGVGPYPGTNWARSIPHFPPLEKALIAPDIPARKLKQGRL